MKNNKIFSKELKISNYEAAGFPKKKLIFFFTRGAPFLVLIVSKRHDSLTHFYAFKFYFEIFFL